MANRYFGTDGIRGKVGQWPLTPEFALKLGWAAGRVFARRQDALQGSGEGRSRPHVLIGKDTRLSGYMFESALEAGFAAAGVDVLLVGPLPTPGIAYLATTFRSAAGVVISASHNPFSDNGVKFFSHHGQKLADTVESEIEAMLDQPMSCEQPHALGRARRIDSAAGRYIEFCKSTMRLRGNGALSGLRIALDCAHGASYHIAPDVFRELGADVVVIGADPDGLNINDGYGSTAPQQLCAMVVAEDADVGIALDGDGDRCIMLDHEGTLVDGDQLLYAIAMDRRERGTLTMPVVGTQMSNLGLELALRNAHIEFERARVGDRYVFERLSAHEANVGGEASGHILCLDRATTGDGIVSALQVLAAMIHRAVDLKTLVAPVEKCPQVLINVPVKRGSADQLMDNKAVQASIAAEQQTLGAQGRVLLRPSGTEPLLRVMVEGVDLAAVNNSAAIIADAVRDAAANA